MAAFDPLQDFITCNICLEVSNRPQSLNCGHVYCHKCIQQLTQGPQVQCPECREACSRHDLERDFRTQTSVDEHNIQSNDPKTVTADSQPIRVCDNCKESERVVKSFCKVCDQFLCIDCQREHRDSKATEEHKLVEFTHTVKDKQRDIEMEMKKLQDKRIDVRKNVNSVDAFVSQLFESKQQLISEVNKCRCDIKIRVDKHHDRLIDEINSTIESLQLSLNEIKTLSAKCDSKLEERVSFLSDVSNEDNFSLITDTLANLSEQIEKDLQEIDRELPKFDSHMNCPISVLKGKNWKPQKSTKVKVEHEIVEQIQKVTPHHMVQPKHKKFHQNYKQVLCVDIDFEPQKLCVCNDELWVGSQDEGVFVYNLNLEQTRHIEQPILRKVRSVVKTPTGMIVCDRDTGVHHLNYQGDYTNLIYSGHFSDVCLTNDLKLYALEWKKGVIHTFVRNQNSWVKDTQFKLIQYSNGCADDKLCTSSTHLYVSSWYTHCLLVYTLNGEYVYKTGGRGDEVGKFCSPYLSDMDSIGKLLVCDRGNHRLQVFHTQNRYWSKLSGLEGVRWPSCAGVQNRYLWVGTISYNRLVKFEVT